MATYGNVVASQFQQQQEKSSLQAAAEAAAKVNAMLIAKGKLRPTQIANQQIQKKTGGNNMVAAEVEINDAPLPLRNMLTRGPTQEEITKYSGAAVSTRGRYMTPFEKMKNTRERPLYLFVQGPNQDSVNVAVQRINEILMDGKNGNASGGGLVRTSAPGPPQHQASSPIPGSGLLPAPHLMPPIHQPPPMLTAPVQTPDLQQVPILEEKLYIGLEHAPPSFDVKNKIFGPGGSFLMHIQTETGAKVMLRGKGSGFIEIGIGREAFEPMYIHIQHPSILGLQQAKQLAENLILTVQQTYASFQQVLAALPSAMAHGHTTFITGIQQPTSIPEGALMVPPPGHPTLTALPESQLIQSASGLQPAQTVIVPSSISSLMMPAGSISSSLPGLNSALGNSVSHQGGPSIMLPTSLSLTPVTVMTTLPISTHTQLLQGPHGALEMGQQQILMSQGAPPQPVAQVNLPPHMSVQTSMPGSMAPISMSSQLAPSYSYPNLQPTVQLVSQPSPVTAPPGLAPPGSLSGSLSSHPPPYQTLYNPEIVSSMSVYNPVVTSMLFSSSPSSIIYSVAASNSMVNNAPTKDMEPGRRRFTEEKDDKIPENLLGYQHGPPHLVNLVCSSPPPPQGQPGLPPPQHGLPPLPSQLTMQPGTIPPGQPAIPPPGQPNIHLGQPSFQPGQLTMQSNIPQGIPTSFASSFALPTVHAMPGQLTPLSSTGPPVSQTFSFPSASVGEDRFGFAINSVAGIMPPPPPPGSMVLSPSNNIEPGLGGREADKHLMPPPLSRPDTQWGTALGTKRTLGNDSRGPEPDRKKRKETGSDEEDGGSHSPTVHRESPKPGTPTQAYLSRSPAYSPTREHLGQDSIDSVIQLPPPPPQGSPQHPHLFQQFYSGHSLPQQFIHQCPPVNHGPPFESPPHHQYLDHSSQPPPSLQFQEIGHQYPGSQGPLPQHSQTEIMMAPTSQAPSSHNPYPPYSQSYSPTSYLTNTPVSSHSIFTTNLNPGPQFIPHFLSPGLPRMPLQQGPPVPPVSQHYHPGTAPAQNFWQS